MVKGPVYLHVDVNGENAVKGPVYLHVARTLSKLSASLRASRPSGASFRPRVASCNNLINKCFIDLINMPSTDYSEYNGYCPAVDHRL